jgi:hypothetical protein
MLNLEPIKPQVLRLSWKSYYEQFKLKHGQPVLYLNDKSTFSNGLLLFPDGWTYSTDGYAGPEYPPPENPEDLKRLQVAYWREKLGILKGLRLEAGTQLAGLRSIQDGKAMPLRYTKPRYDEEGRPSGVEEASVSFQDLGARIDQIDLDIEECEKKITGLSAGAIEEQEQDHGK